MTENEKSRQNGNASLYRYIGLTSQLLVALAVAIYAGYYFDRWLGFYIPVLVWVLPLVVIVAITWQIIKDTSKK